MRSLYRRAVDASRVTLLLLLLVTAIATRAVIAANPAIPSPPEEQYRGCMHDSIERQLNTIDHLPYVSFATTHPNTATAAAAERRWQPLRIRAFTHELTQPLHGCNAAGQIRSNFAGQQVACTAEDVATSPAAAAASASVVTNVLLPQLIENYATRLSVYRPVQSVASPDSAAETTLVVPSLQHIPVCREFAIPAAHQQAGVPDSDFVIYVTSAPMPNGVSAWAATCAEADPSPHQRQPISSHIGNNKNNNNAPLGRPAVAVMAISSRALAQLSASDNNGDARALLMDAMSHAMLHALGFSTGRFRAHGMLHYKSNIRGKPGPLPVLQSPAVVAAAQEHFGCDSVSFMELEDAGEGAMAAHWKLRNARDELMSSSPSAHSSLAQQPRYLTTLTLAAMEDLGYYRAHYDAAEVSQWGRNAGCAMVNERCSLLPSAGADAGDAHASHSRLASLQAFCFNPGQAACTPDHTAMESCSLFNHRDALPPYFQYFGEHQARLGGGSALMDFCPVKNFLSTKITSCVSGSAANFYSTSGINSRCFDTNAALGMIGIPITAFCANVNCNPSTLTYSIQLKGDARYRDCNAGSILSINFIGTEAGLLTITCPPYTVICQPVAGQIPSGGGPIR